MNRKQISVEDRIDLFIQDIENELGTGAVVCVDLVSVELVKNSTFTVYFKGVDVANKYVKAIERYFFEDKNTSLLYLSNDIENGYEKSNIFLHDSLNHLDYYSNDDDNSFLSFYENQSIVLDTQKSIPIQYRSIEWDKWKDMIKQCYPNVSYLLFFKENYYIEIDNDEVAFTAAIWVFLSKKPSDLKLLNYRMRAMTADHALNSIIPKQARELTSQKLEVTALQNVTDILVKKNTLLEVFQEEVDNYGHTIFNIFPPAISGINKVKNQIRKDFGENSTLYLKLLVQEKSLLLTDILFQIIGRREIGELKGKTICGILDLLSKYETSKNVILSYKNTGSSKYQEIAHIDYIPQKQNPENSNANDSFIILWNFWHNAEKYSKIDGFFINVFEYENRLAIEFQNQGYSLLEQNCRFLMGQADTSTSQRGRKGGLSIAKRKMNDLGWQVVEVKQH